MKILGVDYGQRKVGLALSVGRLAYPFDVLRFKDEKELMAKLQAVIKEEGIEKIVIGVSEGQMAEETRKFGKKLETVVKLPVEFFDETLTTKEAQDLAIEAGIKRKKRKALEDAYAACVILDNYLLIKGNN